MKGLVITLILVGVVILSNVSFAEAEKGSIQCSQIKDDDYDLILDCSDKIDVRKSTMDYIYRDFESFSKSFNDATISDIRKEGSTTYANLEIPVEKYGFTVTLNSDIKFSKNNNYALEFLNGKLGDSKLTISTKKTYGFDGTPNTGTKINFLFEIKDVPCYVYGLKCGSASDFAFALDRGLDLMEPEAKKIQRELDAQKQTQVKSPPSEEKTTPTNEKSQKTTETKSEQIELRGPPKIDSDNDGFDDTEDLCIYQKETFNGYQDRDGCPDKIPSQKPIPALFVDLSTDPQHYIDRYYNEPQYKKWFDENYPQYSSIYEAVGLVKPNSIKKSDNVQPITPPQTEIKSEKPNLEKPTKIVKNDHDEDGIADKEDLCPNKAEVYNGYIDWDGCPDTESGQIKVVLDDDNDGVLNHYDNCPNMKETHNGFKDNDGCPDAVMQNQPYQKTESVKPIPSWVKNNAKWYSVGSITERDFAQSLQYMIKDDLIHIEKTETKLESQLSVGKIPGWVQNSAGWWADGEMTDKEFIKTIQYLVDLDIIRVY